MHKPVNASPWGMRVWRRFALLSVFVVVAITGGMPRGYPPNVLAQADPQVDEQIEQSWHPAYLKLATGDPNLTQHGVYAWPFTFDSIGWSMQSYQDYGGQPYFHHGMDMMVMWGTDVFNRSGGQVVNIENYQPGNELYWEVAILDPDGYIWQYHHIQESTIPQFIWDKFAEWQNDHQNGGFIPQDTLLGKNIEWPVWSFGKQFNHIHLNILAEGGVYVNGFEFHEPLSDTVGPEIQGIGLIQNGQVIPGNTVEGSYSLYVHARDLILDDVFYLPPWDIEFSVDGGPVHTTWQFNTLPGGADDTAYLDDFYVVPPTCGDYGCRDYYIDLGFIPDSQYGFPWTGGQHTIDVTVKDYAGNVANGSFTYSVIGAPPGLPIWQDDFETDLGWITNPDGTDTATSGLWERGIPEATNYQGAKQLGSTPSGVNDLVTGRLAGANANSNDVDGGMTSIRSPEITLPTGSDIFLSLRYYLAHASNSTNSDYLRLKVVGTHTEMLLEELGAANNDNGAWAIDNVSLNTFAGDTIHLLIEAADEGSDSLVEAGIDNVAIFTTNGNHAPIPYPQSLTTVEDTPAYIYLDGGDQDGDPLAYSIFTNPQHGALDASGQYVIYTPAKDYFGTDSFQFQIHDGYLYSEPATISLEITPVQDAPIALPQTVTTPEDTPLPVVLGVYDPDGQALSFSLVSTPTHGTLGGVVPNLVYTPTLNYYGNDGFSFLVTDGISTSKPAAVTIHITAVNDAPVANPQSVTTGQNKPMIITLIGTDVENNLLTFNVLTQPTHGSLSGSGANLVYTPDPGYLGTDSFTFLANDGALDSLPAQVDILVTQDLILMPLILR